jgi:hypothetical protein
MSTKLLKLDELKEGRYEAPFGRVVVNKVDGGYKIVVYINEKSLEKDAVKEVVQSLLNSAGGEPA